MQFDSKSLMVPSLLASNRGADPYCCKKYSAQYCGFIGWTKDISTDFEQFDELRTIEFFRIEFDLDRVVYHDRYRQHAGKCGVTNHVKNLHAEPSGRERFFNGVCQGFRNKTPMNVPEHQSRNSSFNATVAEFERKFKSMQSDTIEDVADWYTNQSGGAEMHLRGDNKNGPVATVSDKNVGGFGLRVFNWGVPVHGLSVSDTSIITINMALNGTRTVQDQHFGNISWQKNQAGIYRLDAGTAVISDTPHSLLHLILPVELLETRARSIYAKELNEPLRFSPVIDLSKEGSVINSMFGYLLAQTVNDPDALKSPTVEASFRELIISTVFGTLEHNYGQELSTKVDCACPRSVKRAEDYMRHHAEEPISLQILAREAGCSERALQTAFKSFRSVTPMGALREIRLEKAHQDLKEAADTVTGIAYKWGFSSPGRFAAQYAEKFGKRPSQTQRFG